MKPYPALKTRYYYETKELLEQYKDYTIKTAADKLGIDPSNLRTLAYRMGVEFHRANGKGKTTIRTVERKRHITLPVEPWKEIVGQ
tara:strand:- start:488 stop:745 length:258 start_codon:yes stop_codon:yes gene_type:complete